MALADQQFEQLEEAISAHDIRTAFEKAHALKGVLGNVSLTNLLEPVVEMTEDLRAGKDIDYSEPLSRMKTELGKLRALL